ncbi:MAG: response regulator transcription factor [Peptococcaceae bacterium]|nr:response regulator transcription factor [Peptococcaceae bacterium]
MSKILLVGGDAESQNLLQHNLTQADYDVIVATEDKAAIAHALGDEPDLAVITLSLSGPAGLEICRTLRVDASRPRIPLIVLSDWDDPSDKVMAFYLGADDYVVKPFSLRELIARIEARLRDKKQGVLANSAHICLGDLEIWPDQYYVALKGNPIKLTVMEFNLMKTFVLHPNKVYTRELLLQEVWGDDLYDGSRKIDVYINKLRQKLQKIGNNIETIRGVGYRFTTGPRPHAGREKMQLLK